MFVRGGVVNLAWMEFFKDFFQAVVIADGADDGFEIQVWIISKKFLLDVVGVILVNVEDDEKFWFGLGNLATKFGADRPTTTGDENNFASEIIFDFFVIDNDLVAAKEVFIGKWADFVKDATFFVVHGGVDRWENLDFLTLGLVTFGDDAVDLIPGSRRDSDDNVFYLVFDGEEFDVFEGALDSEAADVGADLGAVIVNYADDFSIGRWVVVDFVDNHASGVTCANEHGSHSFVFAVQLFIDSSGYAIAKARETSKHDKKEDLNKVIPSWHVHADGWFIKGHGKFGEDAPDDDV